VAEPGEAEERQRREETRRLAPAGLLGCRSWLTYLAERRDDIPTLIAHFMKRLSAASGLPMREIGDDAMAVLQAYAWPGNVRQLRNVVERVTLKDQQGRVVDEWSY